MTHKTPRGRPSRYSIYEDILKQYPAKSMNKRPVYVNNIGIFRGKTGDKAYIKIFLRHGGTYKGRSYPEGHSLEISLGSLKSWNWQELEAHRDNLQARADKNQPLEDRKRITFKDYAEGWMQIAQTRQKSPLTSRYTINNHLLPFFSKKEIEDVNVRDINLWQAGRMKKVKPSTVQREKAVLCSILNSAKREELIQTNPCDNSDKIKITGGKLNVLKKNEILIILEETQKLNQTFGNYVAWLIYSAMRRSEALYLEWTDIKKLENGRIIAHIPDSKSGKPRQLPCNEQMLKILSSQRENVPAEEKRIFPISQSLITRKIKILREKTKIDFCIHDFRRTNITYSLISGVDPKTLTGITGHKDLQMIQKYYSVVLDTALKEASIKTGNYIEERINEARNNRTALRAENIINNVTFLR